MPFEKKLFTFDEIKQKMVNYCVYQDRCHYEVEQKMREFVLIPEANDEIIVYLIQENYLNEERFVRSYVRGKFYIKHWGRNKIRLHLKHKGINDKLISKGMEEIEEEDYQNMVLKLCNNYYEKLSGLKHYEKKNKTIKYLINKGFEYEYLSEIFSNI